MNTFKKFLIIFLLILVALFFVKKIFFNNKEEVILSKHEQKYNAIKSIIENYDKTSKETNYYYCEKFLNTNTVQTVWRKGNIALTRLTNDQKSIIMLSDTSNNTTYQIDEINKTYKIVNNSNISTYLLPKYDFINYIFKDTPSTSTYKTLVEDPNLKIMTDFYNNIECYMVSYENTKIYHDRKTGIPIASFINDILNIEVSYSIGEVTNADVQIDLRLYTQIK